MKHTVNFAFFISSNAYHFSGDILDYVTAQVPPPQPHQARPRFSLYLTCQLQYGVVVVFHRQCGFLLGEGGTGRIK